MNAPVQKPLYLRAPTPDKDKPFDGDLFERQQLAARLTGLIARLPDGAVIAIDAAWGEGKTWFGRNWHAGLAADGFRTAYIDCFERDHIEDPFVMIAGELLQLAKTAPAQSRKKFVEASKKLGMALLPATTKFAVNTVGHWAIGKADLGDELAKSMNAFEETSAGSLEKLVAKRLEGYEADKRSVEGFKTALADLARDGEKPIVIFLDELDRCRPDFAVRTIERMKHFFEAPKVVFVLLMNRKQLVAAVQGIYGQQIDANAYLAKFVQLSLALPKKSSADMHTPDDNQKHCDATLVRYGFERSTGNNQFAVAMGVLAFLLNLSLRDVERAVALYSLAQPLNATAADAAWPIAIKLSDPDLFARLLKDERSAHEAAETLARNMRARTNSISPIFDLFAALHHSGGTGFANPMPDEQFEQLGHMYKTLGPRGFFLNLFSRMELDITR